MAEDFKIQLSVKIGYGQDADMVNIRANTPEEFAALLQHAQVNADLVAATSARLKGAGAVVALTSPAQPTVAPVATPAAVTPPVATVAPYIAPGGPTGGAVTTPPADYVPQPVAPVAAPQAAGPAGAPPMCIHGARQFRASKPGAARAWQAWMCPTAKGTPGQCEPEWIQ